MNKLILFILFAVGAQSIFAKPKISVLVLNGAKLTVEVADNDSDRQSGLMLRTSMPPNNGMLFIFENEQPLSFWMKNTYIPLSIGFFSRNKELVDIQDMDPVRDSAHGSIPTYRSRSPAMYALEVNKGWFKKNRIKVGTKFKLINP